MGKFKAPICLALAKIAAIYSIEYICMMTYLLTQIF